MARHLGHMKRHRGIVYDAVFSPDGKFLASGSADGTVNLWDALDGRHLKQLPPAKSAVMSLAISADGNTLIAGTGAAPFEIFCLGFAHWHHSHGLQGS